MKPQETGFFTSCFIAFLADLNSYLVTASNLRLFCRPAVHYSHIGFFLTKYFAGNLKQALDGFFLPRTLS
ncbi:hypothetical protein [Desulforamulus profundi]|uniref:hypothetical protein n=1 Tax=Desulforamulus profundi TaxID=1383067 RepID=UPI001EE568AE|nr:hypothetical protein [Desulforamulus profundi]